MAKTRDCVVLMGWISSPIWGFEVVCAMTFPGTEFGVGRTGKKWEQERNKGEKEIKACGKRTPTYNFCHDTWNKSSLSKTRTSSILRFQLRMSLLKTSSTSSYSGKYTLPKYQSKLPFDNVLDSVASFTRDYQTITSIKSCPGKKLLQL